MTTASIGIGLLMLSLVFWQLHDTTYLSLHFNSYALLSFTGAATDIVLLYLINRTKSRAPETFWFSVFLCEVILWGLLEGVQRLCATPQGATFWYSLTSFAWVPLGVTMFMYALTMTGRLETIRNVRGIIALVAVPVLFLGVLFRMHYLIDFNPLHTTASPWGYQAPYSAGFGIFLAWLELLFLASLWLMYRHYRQTTDSTSKRRALFNIIGLAVPLVGGSLTDGLLPLMHIRTLPVAVSLTSVMTLITGYAILRYRIFTANPALVASNILKGMSETVLILNRNFEVEYANPGSARLFGYEPNELERHTLEQLVRSEDYDTIKAMLSAPITQAAMIRQHVEIINKDGASSPAILSINPTVTGENGEQGYVVVATDISTIEKIVAENRQLEDTKLAMLNALEDAQKLEQELQHEKASVEHKVIERTEQLSKEQARLQASINSLRVGFIITDEQNQLLSANTAARNIFEAPRTNELPAFLSKTAGVVDLEAKIKECITTRKSIVIDEILLESRYLQVIITPVLLSKQRAIGTVMLVQDITEAKVLQRSRDEFFSIASHELRTPLTAIRGNSSLIQTYFADELKGHTDLRELIDDIHTSSIRLIDIVNDFLNVSRLEQGNVELDIKEITLKPIVDSVTNEIISISQENKVKIINKLTGKYVVLADADRVKQVIYNFIGNAMKFTTHGSITISSEVKGKHLKVLITDTGSGIPLDRQHLLFHKFQQASNNILTRDTTRGTGLGLYISKLLVEKMQGKIRLEHSEEGKGSTFSFTLPLAKPVK